MDVLVGSIALLIAYYFGRWVGVKSKELKYKFHCPDCAFRISGSKEELVDRLGADHLQQHIKDI